MHALLSGLSQSSMQRSGEDHVQRFTLQLKKTKKNMHGIMSLSIVFVLRAQERGTRHVQSSIELRRDVSIPFANRKARANLPTSSKAGRQVSGTLPRSPAFQMIAFQCAENWIRFEMQCD